MASLKEIHSLRVMPPVVVPKILLSAWHIRAARNGAIDQFSPSQMLVTLTSAFKPERPLGS